MSGCEIGATGFVLAQLAMGVRAIAAELAAQGWKPYGELGRAVRGGRGG